MASLTVRKLDEDLKASLRLRAAKAGRSVEDEVRRILREATEGTVAAAVSPVHSTQQPHRSRAPEVQGLPRVTPSSAAAVPPTKRST